MSGDLEGARAAKAALLESIGEHPAVRGVGITRRDESYALKLNLAEAQPRGLDVPKDVLGVPVVVDVVGRIVAS